MGFEDRILELDKILAEAALTNAKTALEELKLREERALNQARMNSCKLHVADLEIDNAILRLELAIARESRQRLVWIVKRKGEEFSILMKHFGDTMISVGKRVQPSPDSLREKYRTEAEALKIQNRNLSSMLQMAAWTSDETGNLRCQICSKKMWQGHDPACAIKKLME